MGNTNFCALPNITEFIQARTDSQKIETREYQLVQEIKDPRFGQILLMSNSTGDHHVFIKERELDYSDSQFDEIKFRSQLSNPFLLEIYGFKRATAENRIQVYFEAFESDLEKDIQKAIADKTPISEEKLETMLHCTLNVLAFLQENCVPHQSITPANILRTGFTYKLHENSIIACTPSLYDQALKGQNLRYLAPELLVEVAKSNPTPPKHNSFRSDVYSLGICLLDAGVLDFGESTLVDRSTLQIIRENLDERIKRFKQLYSPHLASVIEEMVSLDPRKRPDALALYQRLPSKLRSGRKKIFAPISDSPRDADHPLLVQSKIMGTPRHLDFGHHDDSKIESNNIQPTIASNKAPALKQSSNPAFQEDLHKIKEEEQQQPKTSTKINGTIKVEKIASPFGAKTSSMDLKASKSESKSSDSEEVVFHSETKPTYTQVKWSSLDPMSIYRRGAPSNTNTNTDTKPNITERKFSDEEKKCSETNTAVEHWKQSQSETKVNNPYKPRALDPQMRSSQADESNISIRSDKSQHRYQNMQSSQVKEESILSQQRHSQDDLSDITRLKLSESILNDPILSKFVQKMHDQHTLGKYQPSGTTDSKPTNATGTQKLTMKSSLTQSVIETTLPNVNRTFFWEK